MKFLNSLNDLKKNTTICIYGKGETGLALKNEITSKRRDIKILCFIDSFSDGAMDDIDIIQINNFVNLKLDYDHIIIASIFALEISNTLKKNGLFNYMIISDYLVFKYSNLSSLGNFYWSSEEFTKTKSRIRDAKKLFHRQIDIATFRELIRVRVADYNINSKSQLYFFKKTKAEKQYLDHISLNSIEYIIEGGMANGVDTDKFLKNCSNLKIIYAFEPMQHLFTKDLLRFKNNKKVKIFDYALGFEEEEFLIESKTELKSNTVLNHNSSISTGKLIKIRKIDNILNTTSRIDLIKLDIEGYELNALMGAINIITKFKPMLAISIYHKKEDIIDIPLYLHTLVKEYEFYLENYSNSIVDTVLYAIPIKSSQTNTQQYSSK